MNQPENTHYRWVVLIAAFVILVLGYAIRNCFSVFYPAIVEEFGWQRGNTALIFSISIIVYGLSSPLAGGLVDRFSPRVILPIGGVILGGGMALCSQAATQWEFYFYYGVLVAIGLSLAGWTPLTTIVSSWFVNNQGLPFGVMTAGFGSSLIYATLAQFLISTFGWKSAYFIIGVSAIALIVPLAALFMRRKHNETKQSLSLQDNSASNNMPDRPERKLPETTETLFGALKTYRYWLLFFIGFCHLGIAEYIAIAHQVYFFLDAGYSPMLAANIYSTFGITFVLGTLISFSSDRLGREIVFNTGCLFCAVAVFLLFFIKDPSKPWMGFLYAVLFGSGMGIAAPVFFTTVADLFMGRHFGSIQGTMIFGISLSGATSPWVAGFLHDKTGSYFTTYLIMLGSLLLCLLLMRFVAPHKVRPVVRLKA